MGMFIKFECDTCGEYECDHSIEERNKNRTEPSPYTTIFSNNEPKVCHGDIIFSHIEDEKVMNEAWISRITENGEEIFVIYIDGRNDGKEIKWNGSYFKIGHAIGLTKKEQDQKKTDLENEGNMHEGQPKKITSVRVCFNKHKE